MNLSLIVNGSARDLHPIVRDEIYRIADEAIRNARQHSGGRRLEVTLEYARDIRLRVRDDGIGIPLAVLENGKDGHFGIRGMRERAERNRSQGFAAKYLCVWYRHHPDRSWSGGIHQQI
jgi:signal transduction histidine kinase